MIVHLSIHTPKPGREQHPIDSMHRFGADLFDEWEADETESFLLEEA